jgi:hypothetical protein
MECGVGRRAHNEEPWSAGSGDPRTTRGQSFQTKAEGVSPLFPKAEKGDRPRAGKRDRPREIARVVR